MEHHSDIFQNRIIEAIRTGDVMCLFFPHIGKTLVMDMRYTLEIPPDVIIDDMVTRPRERLERLEALRPLMPTPEELRIAPWIGTIASLKGAGVADAILERCAETGNVAVVESCRAAFETLSTLETRHLHAIVNGRMSRTLWQREPDE